MELRKTKLGMIGTVVSALIGITYYAFQAKDERLGAQTAITYALDEQVPVKVRISTTEFYPAVIYLNGTTIGADAYGMMVITLADWQANPKVTGDHELDPPDFPVVAFFNSSAFDVTGALLVIRRAADGELVSEITERPEGMVRVVWPDRRGGYNVLTDRRTKTYVPMDQWYVRYMGVTAQEAVAAPATTTPSLQELKQMLFNEKKPQHEPVH